MNASFWNGKRVLVTGHTGFKGAWLCAWLHRLGATVAGYALPPTSTEGLFSLAAIGDHMTSVYGDMGDRARLESLFDRFRPDVVFHLAAQSLVRASYADPVETYRVNIMGTVYLLEAVRKSRCCRVVVNVTSDKCYENAESAWGYRESDPMGGHDPYASSKGCSELVTAAYRRSFFDPASKDGAAAATARAGNVIGGGDVAADRIVPDIVAAIRSGRPLPIRNPDAVRPWQHVLEPLSGYLLLAEKLWADPATYARGWNFGPGADSHRPVRYVVETFQKYWGERLAWELDRGYKPHETQLLALDSTKARMMLGWQPRWTLDLALRAVVDWHKAHDEGKSLRDTTLQQIASYERALSAAAA